MTMADETKPNEIVAAAQHAKAQAETAKAAERERKQGDWPIAAIGIGVGVGSAALTAALLYANRHRGKKD
jgi:hypothetical protein